MQLFLWNGLELAVCNYSKHKNWKMAHLTHLKALVTSTIAPLCLHIKRSAWNHWWSSKSPFFFILINVWVMAKKNLVKLTFPLFGNFFYQFFGYKSEIFYILQNGFLLDHQWFKALLLMYNMTIFEEKKCWPLFVTFEVTASVGKGFYF